MAIMVLSPVLTEDSRRAAALISCLLSLLVSLVAFPARPIYTVVPCAYHFDSYAPSTTILFLPPFCLAFEVVLSVLVSVLHNGSTGPDRSETDQGEARSQSARISWPDSHERAAAINRVQGGLR